LPGNIALEAAILVLLTEIKANIMKSLFLVSALALALSSGAALAGSEYHHHHHHHLAASSERMSGQYYGYYQPAPSPRRDYIDPFGTYSVLPSPVSDQ
jgi:hypothetical protein